MDAARFEPYRSALAAAVVEHGMPPSAYIDAGGALFERIHAVEGRFNRMVIYRGNTLHCAALGPGFAPVTDPARGRLTLNLFLRTAPDPGGNET